MERGLIRFDALKRSARRALGTANQRVGRAGIAGVALLIAAAALFIYAPQMSREAERTRAAIDSARVRLVHLNRERTVEPGSAEEANRARAWLSPYGASTRDLRTLFSLADELRITLPKADYALKKDAASGIAQIDVALPVEGSYRDIRAFVANVLNSLPNASLDEMRMERSASSERLEVRLRITLFYRET